ncbi:hypothetical protein GCM10027053_23970 [Intrasporangium mesophilum]
MSGPVDSSTAGAPALDPGGMPEGEPGALGAVVVGWPAVVVGADGEADGDGDGDGVCDDEGVSHASRPTDPSATAAAVMTARRVGRGPAAMPESYSSTLASP